MSRMDINSPIDMLGNIIIISSGTMEQQFADATDYERREIMRGIVRAMMKQHKNTFEAEKKVIAVEFKMLQEEE